MTVRGATRFLMFVMAGFVMFRVFSYFYWVRPSVLPLGLLLPALAFSTWDNGSRRGCWRAVIVLTPLLGVLLWQGIHGWTNQSWMIALFPSVEGLPPIARGFLIWETLLVYGAVAAGAVGILLGIGDRKLGI